MVKSQRIKKSLQPGLLAAINAVGTRYRLAKLLEIEPSSVLRWHRVPSERIIEVERVTGVSREILRPDLYRKS